MPHWIIKSVSQIGTVVSGATPRTGVEEYWGGSITWITPNDLSKLSSPYLLQSERNISDKGLESCSAQLVPAGNLVLSSRAPIGYFAIPQVDFTTNQGCKSIVFEFNQHPLFHYYNFISLVNRFKEKGEGTTFAEISKKAIEKLEFQIPDDFEEQVVIAKVINTIDQAIFQTTQLIAKYEQIKTGLMQDLLSRGIDEDGNIRSEETHKFKDSPLGRIPDAWVVKPIKDLISITTGSSDTQDKIEHGQYPFFVRSQTVERSNQYIFDGEGVLTSGDGVGVGKIYHYINGKFDFHQRVYLMYNFNKNQINGKYFYYYFKEHFNEEVAKYSAKTTVDSVRLHMIADMLIPIPKYDEQVKIVSLLDSIESTKEEELRTLFKYQSIKNALMQDLLTGKVRVDALMKQTSELV